MALLEIRNITRRFADFEAVKDISFAVESGEFFTLPGPSGCGKTTILRMIAGFDLPDAVPSTPCSKATRNRRRSPCRTASR